MKKKVKGNSGLLSDLLEILDDGSVHSTQDLSNELNCTKNKVRTLIQCHRRQFNNGDSNFWVFSTRGGYTIDDAPENVMYESRMRLAMGTGVIFNGISVIRRAKRIALGDFNTMMIEFKPKLISMGQIIK